MRGDWQDSGSTFMRYSVPIVLVLLLAVSICGGVCPRDRSQQNRGVERTVSVDSRVSVSACTLSGSFTVRSWDRSEVRARASNGADIELTRVDQTRSGPATELKRTANSRHPPARSSCLMLGDVEID